MQTIARQMAHLGPSQLSIELEAEVGGAGLAFPRCFVGAPALPHTTITCSYRWKQQVAKSLLHSNWDPTPGSDNL